MILVVEFLQFLAPEYVGCINHSRQGSCILIIIFISELKPGNILYTYFMNFITFRLLLLSGELIIPMLQVFRILSRLICFWLPSFTTQCSLYNGVMEFLPDTDCIRVTDNM